MSENGKQLRVVNLERTFFTKITDSISKMFLPTQLSFNSIMISVKRNNVLKAHNVYMEDTSNRKDLSLAKYENVYSLYLEAVDKFVMESIYKKVKKNVATSFEANALSRYYDVVRLKETEYTEYKFQKQKYLLDLDSENVRLSDKVKTVQLFNEFYCYKMDGIYKSLLKHYCIQLADSNNKEESKINEIHDKIFTAIEEYIENVLPLKKKTANIEEILTEYAKLGKFPKIPNLMEYIEKNIIILGISRGLFAHSFPLIAAEDCYKHLIERTRRLLINGAPNKDIVFKLLVSSMEDYNVKLLSGKVYWDKPSERQEYKAFWEQYKEISDSKQKEVLFLKYDLKHLPEDEKNLSKIKACYKQRLVELGAMRQFKNSVVTFQTEKKKKSKTRKKVK